MSPQHIAPEPNLAVCVVRSLRLRFCSSIGWPDGSIRRLIPMDKKAAQTTPAKKRPAKRRVSPTEGGVEVVKEPADAIRRLKKARQSKETSPPETATLGRVSLRSVGLWLGIFAVGLIAGVLLAGGLQFNVGPTPGPGPAPAPTPEPVKTFRVIFVKESGTTLNAEQTAIPGAAEIRQFLDAKTTKEGDQPGWREFDPQQQTANEQGTMKALWEAVKPKLIPPPCLVVEVNGSAKVMPLPATVSECLATLKKAAGE